MGFDRPYDLAIMAGIVGLVIITAGFGIESINDRQGATVNATYFTSVGNTIDKNLKDSSDDMTNALKGQEGQIDEEEEQSIIKQGTGAIRDLGKTFNAVKTTMSETVKELNISPIYWTLIISMLLITFGVVTYTWIRGQ